MPLGLVERIPFPNVKLYTSGSVLLMAISLYYAITETSDPSWKVNATMQSQEPASPQDEVKMVQTSNGGLNELTSGSNNVTNRFMDIMTYMMLEPFCMWSLINMVYCSLALFGVLVQRTVFGRLRVSEAMRVKDRFWNYVFYKFIFIFGVLNVQYMDEVLLWCCWFTLIGFLHLLGQMGKDRFDYISSFPSQAIAGNSRLLYLLMSILFSSTVLLAAAITWGLPAGKDTFAFMAAECLLLYLSNVHVLVRYFMIERDVDAGGPVAYYTHLCFDSVSLLVETGHVCHMVVYSKAVVSMASLVLLLQLRHLLHALLAKVKRHRLYAALATHMTTNYPMASPEEVQKNEDKCAICWEPMTEARKLPCKHLFHSSCLCRWVQQDPSCPTCRFSLRERSADQDLNLNPTQNHLFHFDGSRYVSWLPSFSVEVTRVRDTQPLEDMADQVLRVFPQYSRASVLADLVRSRSADATVHNILEGRLPPPPAAPARDREPEAPRPSFSPVADEREAGLRRRREGLLHAARARYLQRRSHSPRS